MGNIENRLNLGNTVALIALIWSLCFWAWDTFCTLGGGIGFTAQIMEPVEEEHADHASIVGGLFMLLLFAALQRYTHTHMAFYYYDPRRLSYIRRCG